MKILIIGGTHFIGPAASRRLAQSGHEVTLFHRRFSPDVPYPQIQGDCRHTDDLYRALEAVNPDAILHMVAWSQGQIHALERALQGRKIRAVILSSLDVYKAYEVFNRWSDAPVVPLPLDERSPLRDVLYPYRGRLDTDFAHDYEKILVERAALRSALLDVVILRLGMVYGRNDPNHRFLAPIRPMRRNAERIELPEGMARFRASKCHVEDVAHGMKLAMESAVAKEIYNLAAQPTPTELEWHQRIAKLMNWRGEIVIVGRPAMPDEGNTAQHLIAETGKIRRELGYGELFSMDDGLVDTIHWELENEPENVA
ncbi:MAG: NAD-dependent epimerase/dehydratase family protein [Candidatus Accumulibacter sp.]|nr:NAD-dependent epimerase/dehydratase family protein [Accumulibacter sp.]